MTRQPTRKKVKEALKKVTLEKIPKSGFLTDSWKKSPMSKVPTDPGEKYQQSLTAAEHQYKC